MALYPPIDVLVLPKSVLATYGNVIRDARGRLSILKSRTEELFRAQLAEMFDVRYPDFAGITVRFGEPYLHDAPHHEGGYPVHLAAEHIKLMQLLREEVSVKHTYCDFMRQKPMNASLGKGPHHQIDEISIN